MRKEKNRTLCILVVALAAVAVVFLIAYLRFFRKPIALDDGAIYRPIEIDYDLPYDEGDLIALSPPQSKRDARFARLDEELLTAINEYRAENDRAPFVFSVELTDCARIRANEIAVYFQHTRPNGAPFWTVDPDLVYGEMFARNGNTAADIVNAFAKSDAHRAALLDEDFRSIGVYTAQFGGGGICWMVMLGR